MEIRIGSNVIDSNDIAVIGEATTDTGPFADDHFLVIILNNQDRIECPLTARSTIIDDLKQCGFSIELSFCNITTNMSRVIYPASFKEHPLFTYEPLATGWRGLILMLKNFGMSIVVSHITKEIKNHINNLPKNEI